MNITLQKSDPFIYQIEGSVSELRRRKQTHHPVTMVVRNRRHVCLQTTTTAAAKLIICPSQRQALCDKWHPNYKNNDLKDSIAAALSSLEKSLQLSHRHPKIHSVTVSNANIPDFHVVYSFCVQVSKGLCSYGCKLFAVLFFSRMPITRNTLAFHYDKSKHLQL